MFCWAVFVQAQVEVEVRWLHMVEEAVIRSGKNRNGEKNTLF